MFFVLEPNSQWDADHMAEVVLWSIQDLEGFVKFTFLGEHETGDYQWIALWETREQAVQALKQWYEPFMKLLGDYGKWNKPYARLYQVQAFNHANYTHE